MSWGFRSMTLLISVLATAPVPSHAQTNVAGTSSTLPAAGASAPRDTQGTPSTPPVVNADLHIPLTPSTPVVSLKVFPILAGKPFKADVHMHQSITHPAPVIQDGKPLVVDRVVQTEMRVDTQDMYRLLA